MPIYAHHEVKHLWLVDPAIKTLEVYILKDRVWMVSGNYGGEDHVRAEPFVEVEIALSDLWWEEKA